jgi:lambda family phage portal protein
LNTKLRRRRAKPNLADKVIGWLDPKAGFERLQYRAAMGDAAAGLGYDTGKGTRASRDRNTAGVSADDHLDHQTLWDLRETGRDLYRRNRLFRGMIKTAVRNVIGGGGFNIKADPRVEIWWKDWVARDVCDQRGKQTFWQIMANGFKAELIDGDHLIRKNDEGRAGSPSILPVEGDRCFSPTGSPDHVVNGVRLDRDGAPLAYWIAHRPPSRSKRNPLGFGYASADRGQWLDADRILHLCDFERASSTRGEPACVSNVEDLDDLDSLLSSTRIAARLSAMRPFVITKNQDAEAFAQAMRTAGRVDEDGEERVEVRRPGETLYLNAGEEMRSIGSEHPGPVFEPFVRLLCRFAGLPLGLPLELVLFEFLRNFSGSRLALEEAKRTFRDHQARVTLYADEIFAWALGLAIDRGRFGAAVSDAERAALLWHAWIPPGWAYIEPLKDINADATALKLRTTSRRRICGRRGEDWDEIVEEIDEEEKVLTKKRLRLELPDAGVADNNAEPDPDDPPPGKEDEDE